jgi:hypothetical protein
MHVLSHIADKPGTDFFKFSMGKSLTSIFIIPILKWTQLSKDATGNCVYYIMK